MFYEKIEMLLEQNNLNLNKLAKGAGIPQSGTSRWQNGTMPNCEALIKICKYLNVSADYLLDLDEEAPPPNLTDQEKELIEAFRECDSGARTEIITYTRYRAAEGKQKETSFNSKKIG
jgi:transcriptional regulator with XRE-family HTH domain